jgi:hypothetical protein
LTGHATPSKTEFLGLIQGLHDETATMWLEAGSQKAPNDGEAAQVIWAGVNHDVSDKYDRRNEVVNKTWIDMTVSKIAVFFRPN